MIRMFSRCMNINLVYLCLGALLIIGQTSCVSQRSRGLPSSDSPAYQVELIETDSLYDSKQRIAYVRVTPQFYQTKQWMLAYSEGRLIRTSEMASAEGALLAINGGFFDMRKGGSVTYLEVNDEMISNVERNVDQPGSDPLLNGAFIILYDNTVVIEEDRGSGHYRQSPEERAVLVTGPVLLDNGQMLELPQTEFVTKRHPRTCVCASEQGEVILVSVDGRRPTASGMSLPELQQFLLGLGCWDAINFDGGGSTTLWTSDLGIVNKPSDPFGERPVANILYLKKN